MSPTTAFRSLAMAPTPSPPSNSVLDDIFGEPSPPQQATTLSQLDDVFGCLPPSSVLSIEPSNNEYQDVSDIPRLRSIHVTAGYRDGIAVSKAAHVQDGFDEGYPLGAVLGLRAGRAVGVLEGVVAALRCARAAAGKHQASLAEREDEDEDEGAEEKLYAATKQLLQTAREELDVVSLFGPQYFDEEGIWRFHVDGHEEDITFEVVAAQHPLIVRWTAAVEQLARDLDLNLDRLDRRARGDHSAGEQAALLR